MYARRSPWLAGSALLLACCSSPVEGGPPPGPPPDAAPDLAGEPPPVTPPPVSESLVGYLRGAGLRVQTALQLSDGTFLIGGGAAGLSSLPGGSRTQLAVDGGTGAIKGQPGGEVVAFLLHVSADLGAVLRVVHLPPGAATEIRWIRASSAPGQPTGELFLSGTTRADKAGGSGVFYARLDGNFLSAPPSRLRWVRNEWAEGWHQSEQPWDVGSDGRIVYVTGQPFGADWAAVYRLTPDGGDDVVPDWRYHFGVRRSDGAPAEGGFTPASSRGDLTVTRSAIVLKAGGRCDLRSWSAAEYQAQTADGNGGTRQGTWPLDLFFSGPCDPAAPSATGPGYTGYRLGANPTQRLGAIAIDRRDNHLYLGLSIQSRLPDGLPDFEPAVVAMTSTGRLKWWSRLYTESKQSSTPDQYVDALAVDYSGTAGGALVVGARCHGNNVINLWRGDQVAARPGQRAFQNQFTGSSGNIHISWLGKLALRDGALRAATYVAEYADGMSGTGAALADPRYDGWPDPNQGWAELNTTRLQPDLRVDGDGHVYVIGSGRRTLTTRGAHQRMLKKAEGASSWNQFVRVYEPDLAGLRYSSLLTGAWDRQTGAGGDNTVVRTILPLPGGLLAAGYQALSTEGAPLGSPVPVTAPLPPWMAASPAGATALLARLRTP